MRAMPATAVLRVGGWGAFWLKVRRTRSLSRLEGRSYSARRVGSWVDRAAPVRSGDRAEEPAGNVAGER
eukprot:2969685-Alexandrium_andersonii.AAC.1